MVGLDGGPNQKCVCEGAVEFMHDEDEELSLQSPSGTRGSKADLMQGNAFVLHVR